MPPRQKGSAYVRITVCVGMLFVASVMATQLSDWRDDTLPWVYQYMAIAAIVASVIAFTCVWFLGLPLILLISTCFYYVLGRRAPRRAWNDATCEALWPLPFAAVGWTILLACDEWNLCPGDDITTYALVSLAVVLGLWCALTVVRRWRRLLRQ